MGSVFVESANGFLDEDRAWPPRTESFLNSLVTATSLAHERKLVAYHAALVHSNPSAAVPLTDGRWERTGWRFSIVAFLPVQISHVETRNAEHIDETRKRLTASGESAVHTRP